MMMRYLLTAFLLLSSLLSAQTGCFGLHPIGMIHWASTAGNNTGCDEISPTPNNTGPFLSMTQIPDATNGGPLDFVWSILPYHPDDPTMLATIALADTSIWPVQFPPSISAACLQFNPLNQILMYQTVTSQGPTICLTVPYGTMPSIPALVGQNAHFQGFLYCAASNSWAVSYPAYFRFA